MGASIHSFNLALVYSSEGDVDCTARVQIDLLGKRLEQVLGNELMTDKDRETLEGICEGIRGRMVQAVTDNLTGAPLVADSVLDPKGAKAAQLQADVDRKAQEAAAAAAPIVVFQEIPEL